jgi:hypothetical protein
MPLVQAEQDQDADHEAEITDAIGQEGFFAGLGGAGLLIPVADEQVGAQTDQLPEDEHHDQVPGQHDAGHGEHEERQRPEEARLALVVLHVAEREDVHQHADEGDDEHHAPALLVDQRVDARRELPEVDEGQQAGRVVIVRRQERTGRRGRK